MLAYRMCVFLFKQKTAYEMRISDWSSDVCSSDLAAFTAKFTDIQLQATGITAASGLPGVDSTNAPSNTALSINAGSARAKGVEVDGIVSPTSALRFAFGLSYLEQKYIKLEAPAILAPFFQGAEGFTGSPTWRYQAALDYDLPIGPSLG